MPKRASLEQRIEWHREHQAECACRPIPARLLEQMAEQAQGRKPTVRRARRREPASASAGSKPARAGSKRAASRPGAAVSKPAVSKPAASKRAASTSATKSSAAAERNLVEGNHAETKFSNIVLAFAHQPSVSYGGKGFGSSALKFSGKIFAMLTSRGEFVVKLPGERVEQLVALSQGTYFDPGHGRPMKEWLVVPASSTRWLELAKEAHASAARRPSRISRPPRAIPSRVDKAPSVTARAARPLPDQKPLLEKKARVRAR